MVGPLSVRHTLVSFGQSGSLLESPWLYLAVAGALVGLLLLVAWRRPLWMVRAFLWIITRTFYRLRVVGAANVPAKGPALLVCNHVSYIDWLLLLASQKRYIRFVIFAAWTRQWGLRHLLRWAGVIPIDGSSGPRSIVQSLRAASEALKRGELVCIFAEGRMTQTGFLLPFHRGFEKIVQRCPAPVVPVCLYQLWGSIFSFWGGKIVWKWPRQLPFPACVAFGAPLPPHAPSAEVRMAIQKLSADCASEVSAQAKPMHRRFVRGACRHPFRTCYIDTTVQPLVLNYGKVLAGAMCLGRHLRPILGDTRMVGVWLPSTVGGAITNIALALLGRTSVNLNYTSSVANVQSAIRQCAIRHVLTSRRFVDKVPFDPGPGVEVVYLEDLRERISSWERIRSFLIVVLLPGWLMEYGVLRLGGHQPEDLATVVFSSGSTGEPKGVMLTNRNVTANADSMIQAIEMMSSDRALGILPFFHSFGYTVTLWVPLQAGASAIYHPDPRQAKKIGELCRAHGCTIFLNTPTFLRFCLRQCEPGDFRTVRLLATGAEKLPVALAAEFQKKFGVLPTEAFGCTELSPAATANVPDRDIDGFKQIGNRCGSVGQPLPGVAVKVVDPETLKPRSPGEEGLLLFCGPNVMKGYLHREELTRKVVLDGWYVTGDMGRIDEEGFVTITGRISRFAKIGGEMVPLEQIEEELHAILQTAERFCAVTSVPDVSRGERLVVLHVPLDEGHSARSLCQQLSRRGLPNLWLPAERDFMQVPELPVLGSGKVNLQRLKELAISKYECGS